MATDLERLVVTLEAQNTKYLKKLDQSEKRMARFRRRNKSALKGISVDFKTILGGVAIGLFVRKVIDITKKHEQAVAQLEAGLASTGGIVGKSLDELKKKAEELQDATTFGDEDLIAAQAQLLSFTSIVGDEFDKTIELAADLSVRFGQDLKSSVLQLGKALNDPVANLGALSRSGIQFNEAQKDMIKQLAKNGDLLSAQKIILKELETQFGGSARAARNTFGGALEALSNAFGDLMEADGDSLVDATAAIEELTLLLKDPQVVAGAQAIALGIANIAAAAAKASTATAGLTKFLAESLASAVGGPAIGDIVRIEDKLESLRKTRDTVSKQGLLLGKDKTLADLDAAIAKYEQMLAISKELITGSQGTTSNAAAPTAPSSVPILVDKEALKQAAQQQSEALAIITREIEVLDPQLKSLADDQSLLNKAFRDGQINAEQYAVAMATIDQKIVDLQNETEDATDELSKFAARAAENMQDAFADFLFDPFDDGLDGMLKGFGDMLKRMIADAAAAKIFEKLGVQDFLGGGSNNPIAGLLGKAKGFFGFEHGGRPNPNSISLVGEGGPELFVPDGVKGTIIPNGDFGSTFNNVFNFPGISNEKEARRAGGAAAREFNRVMSESRRYG